MTAVSTENLVKSAVVVPSVDATNKEAVLDAMVQAAVDAGRIGAERQEAVRHRIGEREAVGSTGIGNGVAVPHMKGAEVDEMVLVLARSEAGIEFQSVDGRAVHLLFMVLAPEDGADTHLQVLRWVSTLARNEDFRRFAQGSTTEKDLRDLLTEMGGA